MWEPRSTLTQSLIVPLPLQVTEGAAFKPERRKRDRRTPAALTIQVHICVAWHVVELFSIGTLELCHKERRSELI